MILHTLLSMITPLGWLMRVPTFKDKVRQMQETEESVSYGLVGYPVLMISDIILYKADTVPVGEDQVPHLELAREIARRFNHLYGQTFPEPQARLTEYPVIVGLDGDHKMSKSLGQPTLSLRPHRRKTGARVASAFTDPQRHRLSDPGRPWVCNVYSLHKFFNPDRLDEVYQKCTAAEMGCVEDKRLLAEGINRTLEPLRERRRELVDKPEYVDEVLREGARRAQAIARETLGEVREKMGIQEAAL